MNILVTGAAGFLGRSLVRALALRPDISRIIAADQQEARFESPKVRFVAGDIASPQFARALVSRDADLVFHLAALVSGGAEQNFELGTRVNLDATRDLMEACRITGRSPRFVFASSIGVYGGELPDPVTDATPASPRLSYGAQKLACEILVNDYTRRGFLDGRSLRFPAVLVRPGAANTALSGWSSAVIREPLAGRDYVCPVRPDTRQPCLSVGHAVEALLRAAELSADALGPDRTVLLTGIGVSAGEMWESVQRLAGSRGLGRVSFRPDAAIQAVMDCVPHATRSARAAALGFRHSSSIDEIVAEYLATHGA